MPSASLFYFTGENTFALEQERQLWCQRFTEKYGAENLVRIDGKGLTNRVLLDEISTAPFLAEKRLCVVSGTPSFAKEEVEQLPNVIHPACVLLIVDPKPDKRLSAVKTLFKVATVKEFPPLAPGPLLQWMQQYAAAGTAALDAGVARALMETAGTDQQMLARELEKLRLVAAGRAITREDVQALAVPSGESEIWQLTNLIAERRSSEALRYARSLLEGGEDPHGLWSILLWMLKNVVYVAAATKAGMRQPGAIASTFGVPFPSVRSSMALASGADQQKLRALVDWAVDTDRALKTGGYRATGEAPQELLGLIDAFILRCGDLSTAGVR